MAACGSVRQPIAGDSLRDDRRPTDRAHRRRGARRPRRGGQVPCRRHRRPRLGYRKVRSGSPVHRRERGSALAPDDEDPPDCRRWFRDADPGGGHGHHLAEADGDRDAEGQGSRRSGDRGQERVPREHEPRDSHADERRAGDDTARARLRPPAGSTRVSGNGAELGPGAAHGDQRRARFLQDRSGPDGVRASAVRAAQHDRRDCRNAHASRKGEIAEASERDRCGRARQPRRRSPSPPAGPSESARQRSEIHPRRIRHASGVAGRRARRRRGGGHAASGGPGHRYRDSRGPAGTHLRTVQTGGQFDDPRIRRHGTGPEHLDPARRRDGRSHLAREREGPRLHIFTRRFRSDSASRRQSTASRFYWHRSRGPCDSSLRRTTSSISASRARS